MLGYLCKGREGTYFVHQFVVKPINQHAPNEGIYTGTVQYIVGDPVIEKRAPSRYCRGGTFDWRGPHLWSEKEVNEPGSAAAAMKVEADTPHCIYIHVIHTYIRRFYLYSSSLVQGGPVIHTVIYGKPFVQRTPFLFCLSST